MEEKEGGERERGREGRTTWQARLQENNIARLLPVARLRHQNTRKQRDPTWTPPSADALLSSPDPTSFFSSSLQTVIPIFYGARFFDRPGVVLVETHEPLTFVPLAPLNENPI